MADIVATVHVPPGFVIHCDASLAAVEVLRVPLEQILHNLVDNALKHHDRDSGVVNVSVTPGREAIFEEGSGMGLALVRKIVERMGGACGVESSDGRGATFGFDWPNSG